MTRWHYGFAGFWENTIHLGLQNKIGFPEQYISASVCGLQIILAISCGHINIICKLCEVQRLPFKGPQLKNNVVKFYMLRLILKTLQMAFQYWENTYIWFQWHL